VGALFVLLGIFIFFFSLIALAIKAIRKKPTKNFKIGVIVGLAMFVGGVFMTPSNSEPVTATPVKTVSSQNGDKAKVEADAKAKAEAEAKAAEEKKKAEEEAKRKVEEEAKKKKAAEYGSGMYVVGKDIQPGLYKSDEGINYWARLNGFSGELGDIAANGTPRGSAIVEIKQGDKGFETQGRGHWYKIDENYQGKLLTSFGDGTYLVGKDIQPGTYKSSEGGSGYWARLSSFSGDLSSIIANDLPQGPSIVKISPNDKGFETFGNGTWTKIE